MGVYTLQAKAGGACQLRPDQDKVIPTLDRKIIQPMALLDLGAFDPAWAGRTVPFMSFFLNEVCTFQEGEDDTWTLVEPFGHTLEWAEPFEDGPEVFSKITPLAEAELVERDMSASGAEREAGVWFRTGEPQWVQSDEAPGGNFRFIAQMDSYYANGRIYVFYDPELRQAAHVCQFS